MKVILFIVLLSPPCAQAVMFMWNENGITQMSGRAPECYVTPTPKCPRVDVYHNGQLISSNRTEPDENKRRQIAELQAIATRFKADMDRAQQEREFAAIVQQQKNQPDHAKEHAAYLLSEAKKLREGESKSESGAVAANFVASGLESQSAVIINPNAPRPKSFSERMKEQDNQRKLDDISNKIDALDRRSKYGY